MNKQDNGCGCGCLIIVAFVAVGGGVAAYQRHQLAKSEERAILRAADTTALHVREILGSNAPRQTEEPHESFWPEGEARYSDDGYLISDKYIPLRAIARKPNASLFSSEQLKYPAEVVGIMAPWQPYYVFKRIKVVSQDDGGERRAMLIGVQPKMSEAECKWVDEADCFCWTTRECINIESPLKVYPTLEAAQNDVDPRDEAYTFTYQTNFVSGQPGRSEPSFRMASLPVLRREEGGYWCFVRPEGTEDGYQVCWIKWDGEDPSVTCRIRSSRREFEEYLAGVRQLTLDYTNPEKSAAAKSSLYVHALDHMEHGRVAGAESLGLIKERQQGIPKLTGFLEQPIESDLQYDNIVQRLVRMIQISGSDVFDSADVAYIEIAQLP